MRALLFLLALPLTASVFTFDSNSASFNNANATTVDQGPSAIPGAEMLSIDPSYGETIIGFGIFGHFDGIPVSGLFEVDVPNGVAVQFDGHWLQQFGLGSGVQAFVIPVDWIANDFSAIVYGPGAAAFEVQITIGSTPDASVPEPATVFICALGLTCLVVRKVVRR